MVAIQETTKKVPVRKALRHQESALKGGKSASVSRSGGENVTDKEMGIARFGFKAS
jgi:hypothetical protein